MHTYITYEEQSVLGSHFVHNNTLQLSVIQPIMIFILNNATLQQKNSIVNTRLLQASRSPLLTSFGSNSSEDSRLLLRYSRHFHITIVCCWQYVQYNSRTLAPVHFLLPSMLLTLFSGCRPLMSWSFVTRWFLLIGLHCMLKTRRSSSPISSAKSAAPPSRWW